MEYVCQCDITDRWDHGGGWRRRARRRSYPPVPMCRVCLKRPEIPEERHGRCEQCARAGRVAYRLRLGPSRTAPGFAVKAGELAPRLLRQRFREQLERYAGQPAVKTHLGLHEVEIVAAKDRLETVRIAGDLRERAGDAIAALRAAAERTDAAW
jgi:hypothetical protein